MSGGESPGHSAENGARALLVSESERHAIAAAGPGTEEQ